MMSVGDWLFHLTELLRTTHLVEFSLQVSDWPFALWLQGHFYAIPAFQTLHIISIGILFGSTVMLSLRVLGVIGRDQSVQAALRQYRPWIWFSVLALVASGIVLLISEPVRNMVNSVFWIKMILLLIAVAFSLWFQRAIRLEPLRAEASPVRHASLQVGAVAIVILWCAVMAGGRWIAYAPS
jgi:Ca2+/Na+ antiporter